MAEELRLAFLGGWSAAVNQTPFPETAAKLKVILAYLALNQQAVQRSLLVQKVWPDSANPLTNLRVRLTWVNQNWPWPCFVVTRNTIAFDEQRPYFLDTEAFTNAIQRSRQATGATARANLRDAVALYQGPFLDGIDNEIEDATEMMEWVLVQRARFHAMALDALDRLVQESLTLGDYDAGIAHARQLLQMEPWREESHRHLMQLYFRNGQRSDALQQYALCVEMLRTHLHVAPHPDTQALAEEIRDAVALPADQPLPTVTAVSIPPSSQVPFQVLEPSPYFAGRQAELQELKSALLPTDGRQRRVALVAMGGAGKSTLAREVALVVKSQFPDGVLWANARYDSLDTIAESWARAYGYDFSSLPRVEDRLAALRAILADKQALLVLDDVVVAAKVKPLLPRSAACSILMTTREQPVADALEARIIKLALFSNADSLDLLAQIVGEPRVQAEPAAANALVEMVQHLPLTLTVAAKRLAARQRLRIVDLVASLRQTATLLDLAAADQAVQATLEVSWGGLDGYQQQVLAVIGVFNGRSFGAAAITAVFAGDVSRYWVQDRLDDLVNMSLLFEEGPDRYRQHMLLAEFAAAKLEEMGKGNRPYHAYIHYYLHFAEENRETYSALQEEWANLDAALAAAARLSLHGEVIALVQALRTAWMAQARYEQALAAFVVAETAVSALHDQATLGAIWRDRGEIYIELTQYPEAYAALQKAAAIATAIDDPVYEARVCYLLGEVAGRLPDIDASRNHLSRALMLYDTAGDRAGYHRTQYLQILIEDEQSGSSPELLARMETILANQEEIGDTVGVQNTLRQLINIATRTGVAVEQVWAYARRALLLAEATEDRGQIAMAHMSMTTASVYGGDHGQAIEHANTAVAMLEKHGDRRGLAMMYYLLVNIYNDLADYPAAETAAAQAIRYCQEIPDFVGEGHSYLVLGTTFFRQSRFDAAQEAWQTAHDIGVRIDNLVLRETATRKLGSLPPAVEEAS